MSSILIFASAGIDGVKVDVQNILETLGADHGGRVLLARKYQQALEASIARNFPDNGIISCTSHNTDNFISACTGMVMPMTVSNESMFPPSSFSYNDSSEECLESWGVQQRPNWVTTEYDGYVSDASEFQCAHMNPQGKQSLVYTKRFMWFCIAHFAAEN